MTADSPPRRCARNRAAVTACHDRALGQGGRFRSAHTCALRGAGLRGSVGGVGACGDNTAMESFFALNVLSRQHWDTRDQLRPAIVTWVGRTCHRGRRQRALIRLTPIEAETIHTAAPVPSYR